MTKVNRASKPKHQFTSGKIILSPDHRRDNLDSNPQSWVDEASALPLCNCCCWHKLEEKGKFKLSNLLFDNYQKFKQNLHTSLSKFVPGWSIFSLGVIRSMRNQTHDLGFIRHAFYH